MRYGIKLLLETQTDCILVGNKRAFGRVGGDMKVKYSEIEMAYMFVSSGGICENEAYLDTESGEIYYHSDMGDDDPLPDDIDDEKYLAIPHKNDLDLGVSLVIDFAREQVPSHVDEISNIFRRRGAYGKYKDLLDTLGKLEDWYKYESASEDKAIREWCAENRIELSS